MKFQLPFDTVLHSSAGQAKSLHAEEQKTRHTDANLLKMPYHSAFTFINVK